MTIPSSTNSILQAKPLFASYIKKEEELERFDTQLTQTTKDQTSKESPKVGESSLADSPTSPFPPTYSKEYKRPFTSADFANQFIKDLKAEGYSTKDAMIASFNLSILSITTGFRIYRYEMGEVGQYPR